MVLSQQNDIGFDWVETGLVVHKPGVRQWNTSLCKQKLSRIFVHLKLLSWFYQIFIKMLKYCRLIKLFFKNIENKAFCNLYFLTRNAKHHRKRKKTTQSRFTTL